MNLSIRNTNNVMIIKLLINWDGFVDGLKFSPQNFYFKVVYDAMSGKRKSFPLSLLRRLQSYCSNHLATTAGYFSVFLSLFNFISSCLLFFFLLILCTSLNPYFVHSCILSFGNYIKVHFYSLHASNSIVCLSVKL